MRYPLSANQWGQLFLAGISPESALYNVGWACRVTGPLDVSRLRRALSAVVGRQEALRTRFDLTDIAAGRVYQVIEDEFPLDVRTPDRPVPLAEVVAEPFDLERTPLFRLVVAPDPAGGHLLTWNFHHLVFDGWSVGVLLRDLAAAYARPGEPLPPPPLSYGAHARWQAEAMPRLLARQLPYWRERLAGAPPLLELPADRPRPPAQSFRGAELDADLPGKMRDRLAAAAARARVTLFTLLVAAFKAQLARYTGRQDIVIGCPVGARTRAGTSELVGYFVNMTVLRTEITPELTLGELLTRVRGTVLDALDYQDVPFDTLVTELRPPRSLAANPLFQVLFSYEEDVADTIMLDGATIGPVHGIPTGAAKFDLTMTVRDLRDGLALNIEYATDLFDPATVELIATDYGRVLTALADDPSVTVAGLPLELRLATPSDAAATVEVAATYVAPATEYERRLVGVWSDVLELAGIGTADNFFQLGGNSLSASRVVARTAEVFGCELSVRAIFERPTVAALAAYVAERVAAAPADGPADRVTPAPRLRLSELSASHPSAAV